MFIGPLVIKLLRFEIEVILELVRERSVHVAGGCTCQGKRVMQDDKLCRNAGKSEICP